MLSGAMAKRLDIRTKRVYDPPDDADGARVLVDRVWPRGVRKETAKLALWLRPRPGPLGGVPPALPSRARA
jgi:hypothetical protein